MKSTYVKDIWDKEYVKDLKGWVYRIRKLKDFVFVVLRDSTGIVQAIIDKNNNPELYNLADKLTIESSISISGKLVEQEKAPNGKEIHVDNLEIYQIAEPFPITKDFSEEFLLDVRHLWLRSRKMTAIQKIRHTLVGAIHEFFRKKGFYEWHPPILQPTQSEGGSTLFEVKYFDKKMYLTQTWQLYAELAIFALEKIYDVAPTFRAEKSKTSRHLAEFWMAEMEMAWATYDEVLQIAFEEIKYIIDKIIKENQDELKILKVDIDHLKWLRDQEYKIITYDEALQILKDKFNMEVPWGKDLRTIEEKNLTAYFKVPIAVTHYPKEAMAFYKPIDPEKSKPGREVAKCFDVLAPKVGEIIGGSERDLNIDEMKKYLERDGEDPSNYEWYFDSRRYGSVVHSGYGLGVERVLVWLLNLDNVKDAIPFPRTMFRWRP